MSPQEPFWTLPKYPWAEIPVPVWVFPKHPFFEWEPKDEKSCRVLGIGHEEFRQGLIQALGIWYIHPEIAREFRRTVAEVNEMVDKMKEELCSV